MPAFISPTAYLQAANYIKQNAARLHLVSTYSENHTLANVVNNSYANIALGPSAIQVAQVGLAVEVTIPGCEMLATGYLTTSGANIHFVLVSGTNVLAAFKDSGYVSQIDESDTVILNPVKFTLSQPVG